MIPPPPGQQATTERHTAPVMAAGTWADNAELFPPTVPAVEALEWAIDRATERVRLCERWLTPDWPHGNWRGGFTPAHLARAQAIHAALVALRNGAAAATQALEEHDRTHDEKEEP